MSDESSTAAEAPPVVSYKASECHFVFIPDGGTPHNLGRGGYLQAELAGDVVLDRLPENRLDVISDYYTFIIRYEQLPEFVDSIDGKQGTFMMFRRDAGTVFLMSASASTVENDLLLKQNSYYLHLP